MGLSVEDEVRCPKSGYSIDMLVHDSALEIGGERSSTGGLWAMEFDGPRHFLASGAPTGATLLKRRHLHVLGHTLVSVPYWEWAGCKGTGEREQYLRGKLRQCTLEAGKDSALAFQHHFGQPMSSNVKSDVTAPWQALACAAVSRSDIKVSHASRASPRPCTRSDGAADGCGGAAGGGGCAAGGGGGSISNAWNKPPVSAVLQVSNGDSQSGVHATTFAQTREGAGVVGQKKGGGWGGKGGRRGRKAQER
jgi:hypothetical protein